MNDRRAMANATQGLRENLCQFPSMFAKVIEIRTVDEYHTATATLADLGHGPLAITCAHVLKDFVEPWKAGKAVIRVGNVRISPSDLIGFAEDGIDLATIRLSDEQAADLVGEDGIQTQLYQPTPSRWPPQSARAGETVGLGGFPGEWRQIRPQTSGEFLALLRYRRDTCYFGIGEAIRLSV